MPELAPWLPNLFDETSEWAIDEPLGDLKVIVFGGVPGSGKSTLADALGADLGIHVASLDWILGAFTQYGAFNLANAAGFSYELVLREGLRELLAGRSVILDGIARQMPIEAQDQVLDRWRSLAAVRKASFYAIDCVCSDENLHRSRMAGRRRGIPGWKQTVDWKHVVENRHNQCPWDFHHLLVDSVDSADVNVKRVVEFVSAPAT
jgi:adenylate kinase family enzyme